VFWDCAAGIAIVVPVARRNVSQLPVAMWISVGHHRVALVASLWVRGSMKHAQEKLMYCFLRRNQKMTVVIMALPSTRARSASAYGNFTSESHG